MILAGCEAPLDLAGVNSQLSQPTQRADLFQAAARHQDTVIVVGGMGTIVQSLDGGGNWQRTTLPGKPFLVDVTVCPDGGFHAIDKTDGIWSIQPDGIWTRQALPEMTEPQAMTCDASGVIWVTGGFSMILHSADAGASWETWSLDEDLYLTTIQFIDQQHGIVTGWRYLESRRRPARQFLSAECIFHQRDDRMDCRPQRDHLEYRERRSSLATDAKQNQCTPLRHHRFRQYTGRSRRQRDDSVP